MCNYYLNGVLLFFLFRFAFAFLLFWAHTVHANPCSLSIPSMTSSVLLERFILCYVTVSVGCSDTSHCEPFVTPLFVSCVQPRWSIDFTCWGSGGGWRHQRSNRRLERDWQLSGTNHGSARDRCRSAIDHWERSGGVSEILTLRCSLGNGKWQRVRTTRRNFLHTGGC